MQTVKKNQLQREFFEVSRELEFFTTKELSMRMGHGRRWWPTVLLKELVDNALDACETASVSPVVEVEVGGGHFGVRDNGPGVSADTLKRSLNYLTRVSDKMNYISPTRGQLGNALMLVWAAPYVASGEHGKVEVWSQGLHHTVDVSLDRIAQRPTIEHAVQESEFVRKGTSVRVYLPCLMEPEDDGFDEADYNAHYDHRYDTPPSARELLEGYAAFNPHTTFTLNGETIFEATNRDWQKWLPNNPTSAHWYTEEGLRDLIAAYVLAERNGGRGRTVREFVSEFRGLSSTAKQKAVTGGDLWGIHLRDLMNGGDIDMQLASRLLASMREHSRPVNPKHLGVVGEEHLAAWMVKYARVSEERVWYRKKMGIEDDMPHVVEVAFGVREGDEEKGRRIVTGLNWAPTLGVPAREMNQVIGEMRIDHHDPVTLIVHMARPQFVFTDHGKTRVQL